MWCSIKTQVFLKFHCEWLQPVDRIFLAICYANESNKVFPTPLLYLTVFLFLFSLSFPSSHRIECLYIPTYSSFFIYIGLSPSKHLLALSFKFMFLFPEALISSSYPIFKLVNIHQLLWNPNSFAWSLQSFPSPHSLRIHF